MSISTWLLGGERTRLYFVALAANLLYISTGCVIAWPSPNVPYLLAKGILSDAQCSWVSSFFALGAVFGSLINALGIDRIGRKPTLIIHGVFFLAGWTVLAVSESYVYFLVGRFLGGIGVGGSFAGVSMYVAEIADDNSREAIGAANQVFVGLGFLIQYCVGPYFSPLVLTLSSCYATLTFIVAFLFMPETPYYLLKSGREQECIRVLCKLRGAVSPVHVQREFKTIEESIALAKKQAGHKSDLILKLGPLKSLLISVFIMLFQQISGFNVVASMTQPIFDMTNISISPSVAAILMGLVVVISSCFAPVLARAVGLKLTLICSGIVAGLCNIALSAYFLLLDGSLGESLRALPIVSLVIFNICFCIGFGPIPWTIVAEIFPLFLKGLASSLVGAFQWILAWGVLLSYGLLLKSLGSFTLFLSYGVGGVISSIILCFIVPNTKDLSLQDIQDVINQGTETKDESEDDKP